MIIRQEKPTDKEEIFSVVEAAFLSAEQSDGNEQFLVNALRKGEAYIPAPPLSRRRTGGLLGIFCSAGPGSRAKRSWRWRRCPFCRSVREAAWARP